VERKSWSPTGGREGNEGMTEHSIREGKGRGTMSLSFIKKGPFFSTLGGRVVLFGVGDKKGLFGK